ncbi:MAG: helix-turn-helix domain-containing protein [Cyanobacteriota bacterium]|nr:helix-turn-helix domain-containing protein [Cyanobacteriota bacterium]
MTATCPWAMQRDAAARLGVSERTLHRWRSAGLLRAGEHWRRKFPNPNSPLLYHLERCEQTMSDVAARHPGRMEVAPLASSQRRIQPLEVAPTTGTTSLRHSFPPTTHCPAKGQPREDGESLPNGVIDTGAGAAAEDFGGVEGHRPRGRLRGSR